MRFQNSHSTLIPHLKQHHRVENMQQKHREKYDVHHTDSYLATKTMLILPIILSTFLMLELAIVVNCPIQENYCSNASYYFSGQIVISSTVQERYTAVPRSRLTHYNQTT
jgi:predicted transglutaminase-like protease